MASKIHNSAGVESANTSPRARRGPEKGTRYRSFGTVQKTGNRFAARYTGPDRKYHTAGMTISSQVRAQGWLANELGLIERGEWTPPAQRRRLAEARQITFDEFARDWIETRLVRGRPIKATTRQHYLDIHDRWFAPLHDLPLDHITDRHVERWYQQLPDAPTMRAHSYALLKSIFRTAVLRKLIKESPVNLEGAASRTTPKDINLLTVAQVEQLADAMPARHRLVVLLAAWCGLRFGELTALQRQDFDLDEGTVRVERAAVTVGGERIVTTPKSTAGRRTVYVPPHLLPDIKTHLAMYTAPRADALVFPGANDRPLSLGQVYGHAPRKRGKNKPHAGTGFYRARAEIGRPDFRFHDLRHFAATMAAISGATTKELMQFAGHSDIHVAMRYQEAVHDRQKELARRMTALARPATDGGPGAPPGVE